MCGHVFCYQCVLAVSLFPPVLLTVDVQVHLIGGCENTAVPCMRDTHVVVLYIQITSCLD